MSKRARNRAAVNREKARAEAERREPYVRAVSAQIRHMTASARRRWALLEKAMREVEAQQKAEGDRTVEQVREMARSVDRASWVLP